MDIWDKLYQEAKRVQVCRDISPSIKTGGVAAALLTCAGNIYVGVCIEAECSLGMCAERNAIASMLTHGESEIDKILAVLYDGTVLAPCGVCRELMMQLSPRSGEIEVLMDLETRKTMQL